VLKDLRADAVLEALKGVSFDVAKGKTFGIVGRNGSGESTMLKLIAGIGKPTVGSVRVQGRVSALIELGLILFVITFVVLALAKLLLLQLARGEGRKT